MAVKYPFHNYESFTRWLDSTDPCDEYGFQKAIDHESIPEQITRLEYNLAVYREYMKNESKFPQVVHDSRMFDLKRLREIREPIGQAQIDIEKYHYGRR